MATALKLVMFIDNVAEVYEVHEYGTDACDGLVDGLAKKGSWEGELAEDATIRFEQGLGRSPFFNVDAADESELFFTCSSQREFADFAVLPVYKGAQEVMDAAIREAFIQASLMSGFPELDEDAMEIALRKVKQLAPCVVLVALAAASDEVEDDEYEFLYQVSAIAGGILLDSSARLKVRPPKFARTSQGKPHAR